MKAENLLLAAVSLQREGKSVCEIETALTELARQDGLECHCQRTFAGHVEFLFSDGQCLRLDGRSWTLRQQEQVAPLYGSFVAGFLPSGMPGAATAHAATYAADDRSDAAPGGGRSAW